ncbi:MAG: NADH-ubiquinone oxidoreductase-F iron-sulfur binding region domain-containing protein [Halolamina sp.]
MSSRPNRTGRGHVVRVAAAVDADDGPAVVDAARETTGDVPVLRTGPTGVEAVEPLLLATAKDRTALFPAADPETSRAVAKALADSELPTAEAEAVVEHDTERADLPVPSTGPLSVGRREALGPCGWVDPLDPEAVASVGDEEPSAAARVLGRGRGDAAAGDPVGDEWETVSEADGDPVVVVNANDADARQRGDRTLLAGAPHTVFDAAATVADHVGATDVVVHLNEADAALHDHLRAAVDRIDDPDRRPQLVAGPDEYRAIEPTAALEALEGADRIEPRIQPPGPARHGLYGRPTVVHTPRTFAQVRRALLDPRAVDAAADDPGTRLVTVTGDVASPATVELPSEATLSTARAAVEPTGDVEFACVGGRLGGFVRSLDVPATTDGLAEAGVGTDGSVELLSEERCPVAEAGTRVNFAAEENSGRCVPGREGTVQLAELLRDVYNGSFEPEKMRELQRVMASSSNCLIGAQAPRPARTALEEFEPAFRAHADGRCPNGTCSLDT